MLIPLVLSRPELPRPDFHLVADEFARLEHGAWTCQAGASCLDLARLEHRAWTCPRRELVCSVQEPAAESDMHGPMSCVRCAETDKLLKVLLKNMPSIELPKLDMPGAFGELLPVSVEPEYVPAALDAALDDPLNCAKTKKLIQVLISSLQDQPSVDLPKLDMPAELEALSPASVESDYVPELIPEVFEYLEPAGPDPATATGLPTPPAPVPPPAWPPTPTAPVPAPIVRFAHPLPPPPPPPARSHSYPAPALPPQRDRGPAALRRDRKRRAIAQGKCANTLNEYARR